MKSIWYSLPIVILFLFSFLKFDLILAVETSRGDASNGETSSGATGVEPSKDKKANTCPPALVEWVNDDYKDKKDIASNAINTATGADRVGAGITIFDFPSEAKACQASVRAYEDGLKKSGKKTSLSDAEGMSSYLADRFKQISPSVKNVLNQCNSLTDGKDKVVKARYYMAMEKVEAVNSTILDEMAYMDSLLPSGQVTSHMQCNKIFPFPQLGSKCEEYQKMLNGSCKQSQEQRLNAMVQKTKRVMAQVDDLQKVYLTNCRSSTSDQATCQQLSLSIQVLKSEVPWIDGKKFQDRSNQVQVSSFWKEELKDETLKKGIIEQLTENRKAFLKQYSTNLQQVQCLTYSTHEGKPPCDFEDARKYIAGLPDVTEQSQPNTAQAREFNNYIEAEKCIVERGMDRANTKKILDDAVVDMAVTISTAGLGIGVSAARSGITVVKGVGSTTNLRRAAVLNSAAGGMNLLVGTKQVFESCKKSSENLLKFTGKPEVLKNNVCPGSSSNFEIAQSEHSSCLVDSLLTLPNIYPLIKGLKVASGLSKTMQEDLLKLYQDPKQRAEVEKLLAKNGQLNEVERIEGAEAVLGKKLSNAEKNCVMTAHNIGDGRGMKISESDANTLTQADFLAKRTALKSCGFGATEISVLMRSGITGDAKKLRYGDFALRAESVGDQTTEEARRAFYVAEEAAKLHSSGQRKLMAADGSVAAITSRNSEAISRIKGGFHEGVVDDIYEASVQISKTKTNVSGARNGTSMTDLMKAEDDALASAARELSSRSGRASSIELQNALDLEAWQNLRARTELARRRSMAIVNGQSSESEDVVDAAIAKADAALREFEKKNFKKYENLTKQYQQLALNGGR